MAHGRSRFNVPICMCILRACTCLLCACMLVRMRHVSSTQDTRAGLRPGGCSAPTLCRPPAAWSCAGICAGKTTSARVISSQAAVPLIYLPLEAVLSKW